MNVHELKLRKPLITKWLHFSCQLLFGELMTKSLEKTPSNEGDSVNLKKLPILRYKIVKRIVNHKGESAN